MFLKLDGRRKIKKTTNSMEWNYSAFLALWNFCNFAAIFRSLWTLANCNHSILLKSNKPGIFLTLPSLPLQLAPWDLSGCLISLCDYLKLYNHGLICTRLHTFSTLRWRRMVSSLAAKHRLYNTEQVGADGLWSAASDESKQADFGSRGRDN